MSLDLALGMLRSSLPRSFFSRFLFLVAIMEPASLIFSIAALIPIIYDFARRILERLNSFSRAPTLLNELRTFLHDIQHGQIHLSIRFTNKFIASNSRDTTESELEVQVTLTRLLNQLRDALEEANTILESCSEHGTWPRVYFAVKGQKKLEKTWHRLRSWQSEFILFVVLAEKTRQLYTKDMCLTQQHLRVTAELSDATRRPPLPFAPHVILASAEYQEDDGERADLEVLIEPQVAADGYTCVSQETIQQIAKHLGHEFPSGGVFQCLGYRIKTPGSHFDLVFRIPRGLANPKSLKGLIWKDHETRNQGIPTVLSRLVFARDLARAVLTVHGANMIHKSIRPETILVFEKQTKDESLGAGETAFGVPILTGWSMTRKINELSARSGENDWARNIYRHPVRHGLQLEKRYHMGHDLYSLGICLLELGLWEPLITLKDDGGPESMSQIYHDTALRLACVSSEESVTRETLTEVTVVERVLPDLAEKELVIRMGEGYANIVKLCLKKTEDLHESSKSDQDGSKVGSAYHDWILQPLENLICQPVLPIEDRSPEES